MTKKILFTISAILISSCNVVGGASNPEDIEIFNFSADSQEQCMKICTDENLTWGTYISKDDIPEDASESSKDNNCSCFKKK